MGNRTIPLWYKIFKYREKGNKSFEHVKQGISELNEIFKSYDKDKAKKFNGVLLGEKEYKCNLAVCRAVDSEDTWCLATNMNSRDAVYEYKKRFNIEEMFRDLKSYGFNMEDTWTESIKYFENLYLCLCIAYTWMIILGVDCSKNKKSKIIGATKKIKNDVVRIYSLFSSGLAWFNRCYDADRKKYNLKFSFMLYDI